MASVQAQPHSQRGPWCCSRRARRPHVRPPTAAAAAATSEHQPLEQQHQPQPPLMARSTLLRGLAAGAGALAASSWAPAPPAAAAGLPDGADRVVAQQLGCVAAVSAIPGGRVQPVEQPLGSGLVWDAQGHVVVPYAPLTRLQRQSPSGETQVLVTLTAADGVRHQLPAAVLAKDPSHELILLQVEPPPGGLRPVAAASSAGLRVGQDALLLGALPDGAPLVSAGVVSGLGRVIPASNNQAIPGVLQTDAEVTQQSLGGALLDSGGRLVGMPVVSYVKPGTGRSSGVNFALPADLLLDVVPRLIVYRSAERR